jgi:hypothetical protein
LGLALLVRELKNDRFLLGARIFSGGGGSASPSVVCAPAVYGFKMNSKDNSDFLTRLDFLVQDVGTASEFGLVFLIEAGGIIFHRLIAKHF